MNTKIKFGTDGFRGITGENFTPETVEKITLALAQYMFSGNVIIGYDSRKDADKYARQAAEILAEYGFDVFLSNKVVPTPIVAYQASITPLCAGAMMFTASHNPKEYLGIKFIPPYGGPATAEITNKIEEIIDNKELTIEKKEGSAVKKDFSADYFKRIDELIDFEAIKNNPPKIIYDGLFSASIGYFDTILKNHGIDFEIYNNVHDPNFGGFLPEPKKEFLLHSKMNHITLANDGDADRYGVLDENGNWVSPNIIMAILLKYLKEKGKDGAVVKTAGVSRIVEIVAEKLNIPVVETPVGFKWIGEKMRENKTILGGEDSGGLSVGEHISEKDGIFANLLIIEAISKTNKSLVELEEEIVQFAGAKLYQDRVDIKLNSDEKKDKIIEKIKNEETFGGDLITKKSDIDGVKLYLDKDYTQLLIRKSGTEPLLRFYIESASREKINSLKEFIKGYAFVAG